MKKHVKDKKAHVRLHKFLKPYFMIPFILIVLVGLSFLIWYLLPWHSVTVAVLDKTVPATQADSHSYLGDVTNDYRKHIGLYWLMGYEKFLDPATNKKYNYKTDYYGPLLDDNDNVTDTDNSLETMKQAPDLLYLADTYGTELRDADRGLSTADMNAVALCRSSGSTVIAEQDTLTTGTSSDVSSEIQQMFGITSTGWVGRYIYDLEDMTDVPYWAPPMYLQKYGYEWKCSGPGILLVSGDGDIIVLEESTDFNSKNLLKISVTDIYKKEFGKLSVNYYNWFELVKANYGTETIAEYSFNLNSTGMDKFKDVSQYTVFPAVTRDTQSGSSPAYYFAGDFCDYTTRMHINNFLFADYLFRSISVDRDGDVTHFYWSFYAPMVKEILKDVKNAGSVATEKNDHEAARVTNDTMEVSSDGNTFTALSVDGFNLNAELPGSAKYDYSRDFKTYSELIQYVSDMGGNCIRANDLLPPEFYRALYEHNKADSASVVYLYQGILTPSDVTANNYFDSLDEINNNIGYTIKAVHGDGTVPDVGKRTGASYMHDVSAWVLGFIIDPNVTADDITAMAKANSSYTYTGAYFSGTTNPIESLYAEMLDKAFSYQTGNYTYKTPVSVEGCAALLTGASFAADKTFTFNIDNIKVSDDADGYWLASYPLRSDDSVMTAYGTQFASYTDANGSLPFGSYVAAVKQLTKSPMLVDRFGLSTSANTFEQDTSINGLSESAQGAGLVRMLKAIKSAGCIGGLISDLNDSWCDVSDQMTPMTVPSANAGLWYNAADRAENTGVIAVEPVTPANSSLELNDTGLVTQMQISENSGYLYVTLLLSSEIDYDQSELIIGLDTYQRNNGEYFYDSAYFANSLSGMEYVIKFESKNSASLYCASSYDRTKGSCVSAESYTASYDLVSVLNYGSFSSSNTQFYQSGLTLKVRIPWNMINVTDPTKSLVINDSAIDLTNILKPVQTTATEGMILSVLIGNKSTKDTAYIFPALKTSPSYKKFTWTSWDKITSSDYQMREKESCNTLKKYFAGITDVRTEDTSESASAR